MSVLHCIIIGYCWFSKEAELESIQLQTTVEQLGEEKDRLLNSLIEAE